MISKLFNKLAAKTFANKSKTHVFQPKLINLYFQNSIGKEFKSLNLTTLSAVNFYIKQEENTNHTLVVQMYSYNHIQEMNVASFLSKEEAEEALNEVRVVLYSPMKSFAKWLALLSIIGALGCMVHFHINGFNLNWVTSKTEITQKNAVNIPSPTTDNPMSAQTGGSGIIVPPMPMNVNPADIPPPVSEGEIDNIISQLQQVKQLQESVKRQQGIQQQNVQQPELIVQPQVQQQEQPASPAEQFLKGLN